MYEVTIFDRWIGHKKQTDVHAPGCKDCAKYGRTITFEFTETLTIGSRADLVRNLYPPDDFDYEPENWAEYDELKIFPCIKLV
jgi:hypothetical protein